MTTVFFPGKFQPLHIGHIMTISKLLEKYEKVIIGISGDVPLDGTVCTQDTIVKTLDIIYKPIARSEKINFFKFNKKLTKYKGIKDFPNFDLLITGDNKEVIQWAKKMKIKYKQNERSKIKGAICSGTEIRREMKRMKIKNVKKFWRERATLYGKVPIESIIIFKKGKEAEERDKKLKEEIIKNIDFDKDRKILDVGCGTGRIALHMASKVDFILGIDFTKELIDIAELEKNKKKIENVKFIQGDSQNFKYNEKFDVAIICGLFNYLNDEGFEKTIKNIKNHLKKDGKIIVKEPIGIKKRYCVIEKYAKELKTNYNSIYRSIGEIKKEFEKSGFKTKVSKKFYQHRKETAVWFFVFEKNLKT